jgi:hypothetical protein
VITSAFSAVAAYIRALWVTGRTLVILMDNSFCFLFIYCIFTIYSRYLKRLISKRDGCAYLKQVPSCDGSLELIWWDPFCWVFFLSQVDWPGLLLVGCCFVQSDFCDSSRMFLWLLLHMVCSSRCVRWRSICTKEHYLVFLTFWIETFGGISGYTILIS